MCFCLGLVREQNIRRAQISMSVFSATNHLLLPNQRRGLRCKTNSKKRGYLILSILLIFILRLTISKPSHYKIIYYGTKRIW